MGTNSDNKAVLIIGAGVAVVGVVLTAAWMHGRDLAERDELALQVARLNSKAEQTCTLAWIKAMDTGVDGGRTPSIHPAEVRVEGPPRIVACEMLQTGGVVVEPLVVIERCKALDLDCIELTN